MDLITISRKQDMQFTSCVRDHSVTSDLSAQDGGSDGGLSPSELLASSLGACLATMVQSYCQRQGWEGDAGASLTIEYADKPKRIGRIVVDLELPNSVPDDKKQTIRRVAERCPIHETLRNPPALDIDIT